MPSTAYQRQAQTSFAGGMYRSGSPELMPANAFFDGTNSLLDLLGGVFKRGGSSYRSLDEHKQPVRFLWDGWLSDGQNTVVGFTDQYARLNTDGTLTLLGAGGTAKPIRPAVLNGTLYLPGGVTYNGITVGAAPKASPFYAIVAGRLLCTEGEKVMFSKPVKTGETPVFEPTDYHELPGGVEILGLEGARESAVVFTTGGVWVISNMALNLTDSAGNVQQRLDHYSGDLVLWGNAGIAHWEGSLIVPGTDAIWLVKRGVTSEQISSFTRISDPIVDLYQEYVDAGYEPGQATVFRNHYLLPVLAGDHVVDVLVGRLDMPQKGGAVPWTHLSGFGAEMAALETRVQAGISREPTLIGGTFSEAGRVLNLSWFNPSGDTDHDADGSVPQWALETRSIQTGNLTANLVSRLRVRYQLSNPTGEPKLAASVASDALVQGGAKWGKVTWGTFLWASPGKRSYEPLPGEGPPDETASSPFNWRFARKRRTIRFRLSCPEPTAQLSLKALEVFVRPEGRL